MEKSAYLDAMGITRWSLGSEEKQEYFILVDKVSAGLDNNTIIATALSLIDCPFIHCTFTSSLERGADIIWDMRRIKLPKSNAVLSSAPASELETSVENKRELWNMIIAVQELGR
ncbi:hypothetical protein HQQ94_04730 [Shewanella sp. VB17]|uniref:hypothetical protein n=1 Tax=Shewanella sp. VB17 TaxID=2739432 RepID=UPI001566F341|nr:hypothetical protein [Shewanella sp. VB17]NRD72558.1 hypothetical protein [Shewanella sp. VB17]